MNIQTLRFNLLEAEEQLRDLIRLVEEGEIDEDLFSAGMEHIYHHLNTAWNARNLSDELFYDGNFHDLRKFPDDIIAEFRDAAKH